MATRFFLLSSTPIISMATFKGEQRVLFIKARRRRRRRRQGESLHHCHVL